MEVVRHHDVIGTLGRSDEAAGVGAVQADAMGRSGEIAVGQRKLRNQRQHFGQELDALGSQVRIGRGRCQGRSGPNAEKERAAWRRVLQQRRMPLDAIQDVGAGAAHGEGAVDAQKAVARRIFVHRGRCCGSLDLRA